MKVNLTDRKIKSLKAQDKKYKVWDIPVSGFYLMVMPSGYKVFKLALKKKSDSMVTCKEVNDSHPEWFESLIEVIEFYENNSVNSSLVFWIYESIVLSEMGYRIDLEDNEFESRGYGSTNLKEEKQCRYILQNLINKNFEKISFEKILPREKRLISNYLYNQLCYHIEGFDRLKSFKVAKNILNDL